jgi:hypothetical protein
LTEKLRGKLAPNESSGRAFRFCERSEQREKLQMLLAIAFSLVPLELAKNYLPDSFTIYQAALLVPTWLLTAQAFRKR